MADVRLCRLLPFYDSTSVCKYSKAYSKIRIQSCCCKRQADSFSVSLVVSGFPEISLSPGSAARAEAKGQGTGPGSSGIKWRCRWRCVEVRSNRWVTKRDNAIKNIEQLARPGSIGYLVTVY